MQDIIQKFRTSLSRIYPEPEISALMRLAIEHVTGLSIPLLLSDKNKKITPAQELKIEEIINRLQYFEPIQYIIGETEFYGLRFTVNENVLIPRPETEELVELVIVENKNAGLRILDIGTGSGAIAIALAKYMNNADVSSWDISFKALDVAVLNSKINSVDITFKRVDVLNDYPTNHTFDIIVSNPPYVLDSEKEQMSPNVLDFEPHSALFVPDEDALVFYERIADIARKILNQENGKLYFEINRQKGHEIISMLENKGFSNIGLVKDISGNDRIVKAELKQL